MRRGWRSVARSAHRRLDLVWRYFVKFASNDSVRRIKKDVPGGSDLPSEELEQEAGREDLETADGPNAIDVPILILP